MITTINEDRCGWRRHIRIIVFVLVGSPMFYFATALWDRGQKQSIVLVRVKRGLLTEQE